MTLARMGVFFIKQIQCKSSEVYYKMEENVLFNDSLSTFYLRLYGVRHMVKNHSDREIGNLLRPHGLLFPISSKGSFICIIPQQDNTYHSLCYTSRGTLAGTRNIYKMRRFSKIFT